MTFSYLAVLCAVVGCSTPMPPADVTGADAVIDQTITGGDIADAPVDVVPCTADIECSDFVFCNGSERCSPGAPMADARGCVPSASPPCMATQECHEASARCLAACPGGRDVDGDGHVSIACGGDDCDDNDALRFPGRMEVCDAENHDEDCDPVTFGFRDVDNDMHADIVCCNQDTMGMMRCGDDCDDMQPSVHRTAPEVCDGVDNDCDSMVDEGVTGTFYRDADNDLHGNPAMTMTGCFAPMGYVDAANDCDDANPLRFMGATEVCDAARVDEDCDMVANPTALCSCSGTITRPCQLPGACSTGREACTGGMWGACSITPTTERCDNIDNDCDGIVDESLRVRCYPDRDSGGGDGYAASGAASSMQCTDPARTAFNGCPVGFTHRAPTTGMIDCDDAVRTTYPGAPEICNGVSDDCDSSIDEGLPTMVRYYDYDGDGRAGTPAQRCATDPRSFATSTDCNDLNSAVFEGQEMFFPDPYRGCTSSSYPYLCYDTVARTHRCMAAPSSTSNPCTGGGAASLLYDYNCNDVPEREPPASTSSCASSCSGATCSAAGSSIRRRRRRRAAEVSCGGTVDARAARAARRLSAPSSAAAEEPATADPY